MFPEGRPTAEEQAFMEDHGKARRINRARDNGHKADFFSLADQDRYVTSSSVKGMMWEVADGDDALLYEMGTLYLHDDEGRLVGRVQIEERSSYPFDHRAKRGAPMCLALTRPDEPLESRREMAASGYWSREVRIVETEEVSVHAGPHGIEWCRVWDQREVAQGLSEHLGTDPPPLR